MRAGFKRALSILQLVLIVWAMSLITQTATTSVMTSVFLIIGIVIIKGADAVGNRLSKNEHIGICILAFVFSIMYSIGDAAGWMDNLENKLFKLIIVCIGTLGLFFLFYSLLKIVFAAIDNREPEIKTVKQTTNIFLIGFIVCLIVWTPYFLYMYPGVIDPDFMNQLNQIAGVEPYNNHHPWIHTMMMKPIFYLGYNIGGNANFGVAGITVVQMLFCALGVGYFLNTLKLLKAGRGLIIGSLLFFAVVPFNIVATVTIRKDALFAYAVLCLACSLIRILAGFGSIENAGKFDKVMNYVIFTIMAIMMCLLRSNGFPAFCLVAVVLIFVFWKKKLPMLPIIVGVIILTLIIKIPVMNAFNVRQPDFVEKISIPLQMFTRTIVNDRNISDKDMAEVQKVIDTAYVKSMYDPVLADPMKELVRAGNQNYLINNKGAFFRLFISTGIKYPLDYFNAYVDITKGYWFPISDATEGSIEGIWTNEIGVYTQPLVGGPIIVKLKEIWQKLGSMVPVYGTLWSIGSMLWYSLVCFVYVLTHSDKKKFIVFVPAFSIMLSLLIASPISVYRYAYSLIVAIPLFIAMPDNKKAEVSE